jgi:glycosyltransferase involved in cell wall biosynthesis
MPMQLAIWSPDYTQTTGQALVTARVLHRQSAVGWREYVYRGAGWRSFASWANAALRLWRDITFGRVRTLYLVCSRSNGGFLRDIPALLVELAGVRTVIHVHGSDIVDLLASRRLSPLARALYARCDIIVPSMHLIAPLHTLTTAPIYLCENYFAGELGDDASGPPDHETFTILWNSNVMASKGFFDLADAIHKVRSEGFAIRFVSVGQLLGDEEAPESEVRHRLDALLAHDWFDYRGKVAQNEAIALLKEVDAVALPSRYSSECQPLAVIQAMCAGKAVLASDISALRATLHGYPAHFVPVRSVEAIAMALREWYWQWQTDIDAFALSRNTSATEARVRFSTERFDHEMGAILAGDLPPLR